MIKYIKQEMPDINRDGKQKCYYRVESRGNKGQDELVKQMCLRGMSRGMAEMALSRMTEAMVELLSFGYSVTIDNLGCFSLSLGTKDEKEVEELDGGTRRNAASIKIKDVHLKTDKKLLRALNLECHLERGYTSRVNRSKFTPEERLKKAQEFIAKHKMMRIADYMAITGLPKTTASLELRSFTSSSEETGITHIGRGPSLVYVKKG